MASIQFTLTVAGLAVAAEAGLEARILEKFEAKAGPLIVKAIQGVLGQDWIYKLQPEYAERKQRLREFQRIPGKSAAQPLILSGKGIYEAVEVNLVGDSLIVDVDPERGLSDDGFDYAERWEGKAHFLEVGFALVENQLEEILLDIVVAEMGL